MVNRELNLIVAYGERFGLKKAMERYKNCDTATLCCAYQKLKEKENGRASNL